MQYTTIKKHKYFVNLWNLWNGKDPPVAPLIHIIVNRFFKIVESEFVWTTFYHKEVLKILYSYNIYLKAFVSLKKTGQVVWICAEI